MKAKLYKNDLKIVVFKFFFLYLEAAANLVTGCCTIIHNYNYTHTHFIIVPHSTNFAVAYVWNYYYYYLDTTMVYERVYNGIVISATYLRLLYWCSNVQRVWYTKLETHDMSIRPYEQFFVVEHHTSGHWNHYTPTNDKPFGGASSSSNFTV